MQLILLGRSQWPRGLRCRSAAARLLRSWVRIPPGAGTFVCCECCVLSGRDLCDELITRPEESYRLWCVVVCDLETSRISAPYIYNISSLRINYLNTVFLRSRDYACSVRNMGKSVDTAGLLRTVWKIADMAYFMLRYFSLDFSWKHRFY